MKRRISTLLFSALALFAFAFGFTACGDKTHYHEYGKWSVIKPATCTEAGERKRVCSCNEYETEEIPALGHEFLYYVSDGNATCTHNGTLTAKCERCNETNTVPNPGSMLGHDYKDYICRACGRVSPEAPETEGLEYSEIIENGETAAYAVSGAGTAEGKYLKPASVHNGKPVTAIADYAFAESGFESLALPASVETVGDCAFYNCANLQTVTLNGVKTVGELAFADCAKLKTLDLGEYIEIIGDYSFTRCLSLTEADFPASVKKIGECAFAECRSIEKVVMREGLKSIGDCAFGGCVALGAFAMPNSVEEIGWGVLMFQTSGVGFGETSYLSNNLTVLEISNAITEIPDYAFSKCNISSLKIGERVETIRYSAFYGCSLLKSVIVPKTLKKIESYAFYQCASLESVFYEGTEEEWRGITVGKNGNDISVATRYYYSESKPEREGNFWHYLNGEPAVW